LLMQIGLYLQPGKTQLKFSHPEVKLLGNSSGVTKLQLRGQELLFFGMLFSGYDPGGLLYGFFIL